MLGFQKYIEEGTLPPKLGFGFGTFVEWTKFSLLLSSLISSPWADQGNHRIWRSKCFSHSLLQFSLSSFVFFFSIFATLAANWSILPFVWGRGRYMDKKLQSKCDSLFVVSLTLYLIVFVFSFWIVPYEFFRAGVRCCILGFRVYSQASNFTIFCVELSGFVLFNEITVSNEMCSSLVVVSRVYAVNISYFKFCIVSLRVVVFSSCMSAADHFSLLRK